jgi:hypothetical protein
MPDSVAPSTLRTPISLRRRSGRESRQAQQSPAGDEHGQPGAYCDSTDTRPSATYWPGKPIEEMVVEREAGLNACKTAQLCSVSRSLPACSFASTIVAVSGSR